MSKSYKKKRSSSAPWSGVLATGIIDIPKLQEVYLAVKKINSKGAQNNYYEKNIGTVISIYVFFIPKIDSCSGLRVL